jgi:hypothetical protein
MLADDELVREVTSVEKARIFYAGDRQLQEEFPGPEEFYLFVCDLRIHRERMSGSNQSDPALDVLKLDPRREPRRWLTGTEVLALMSRIRSREDARQLLLEAEWVYTFYKDADELFLEARDALMRHDKFKREIYARCGLMI